MNGMRAAELFPAVRRYHGGLVSRGSLTRAFSEDKLVCFGLGFGLVDRDARLLRHVLFQMLPFRLRTLDFVESVRDFKARPAVDLALESIVSRVRNSSSMSLSTSSMLSLAKLAR